MGATIKGMAATACQAERSYVVQDPATQTKHLMVPAVADRLGISRSTLYRRIKEGKIHTEEVSREGKQYTTIPQAEIERLAQEQTWNTLIARYADKQNIKKKSVQRKISRRKQQGLGPEQIFQELEGAISPIDEESDDL